MEETRLEVPTVLSHEVTKDVLNSSFNGLGYMYMRTVVYQGSSLETQCAGFLLGDGHVGALCLAYLRIPNSQKERSYSTWTMLFVQMA